MPYPNEEYTMEGYNRLVFDETSYNKDELKDQHKILYGSLTSEQKGIYASVMDKVEKNEGGMFFARLNKITHYLCGSYQIYEVIGNRFNN